VGLPGDRGLQRGAHGSARRDAVIALADLRGRCIMTTWHPDMLAQDVDVLRDLNARFGGRFAFNAWAGRPGCVAVGDVVAAVAELPELAVAAPGRFA
jgi:hypothetical protein